MGELFNRFSPVDGRGGTLSVLCVRPFESDTERRPILSAADFQAEPGAASRRKPPDVADHYS